jgi:hypothetical protein
MGDVRGPAEPGYDIQGNREDSSIRNSQSAPHRAQLGTAAQSINDTQAAVRLDVVVYHAHSRTGITKRLNDVQKSLRESVCRPRQSRVLHEPTRLSTTPLVVELHAAPPPSPSIPTALAQPPTQSRVCVNQSPDTCNIPRQHRWVRPGGQAAPPSAAHSCASAHFPTRKFPITSASIPEL